MRAIRGGVCVLRVYSTECQRVHKREARMLWAEACLFRQVVYLDAKNPQVAGSNPVGYENEQGIHPPILLV